MSIRPSLRLGILAALLFAASPVLAVRITFSFEGRVRTAQESAGSTNILETYGIGGIVIGNRPDVDTYALLGAAMVNLPSDIGSGSMSFELRDPTATVLDSDDLLLTPPNLDDWMAYHSGPVFNSFGIVGLHSGELGSSGAFLEFEFTDFHAPEPATGVMLGLGLLLLGMWRRTT